MFNIFDSQPPVFNLSGTKKIAKRSKNVSDLFVLKKGSEDGKNINKSNNNLVLVKIAAILKISLIVTLIHIMLNLSLIG